MADGLTPRQQRFCEEYLLDLNATQAAIRAGYAKGSADVHAARLLGNANVAAAIAKAQAERSERTGITADLVLKQWWEIATASANDLIQLRRTCCRYCHGEGHEFQWTQREYCKAVRDAEAKEAAPPDVGGGFGFDPTLDPHPDCPECRGEGQVSVHPLDSRKLRGKARLLYAGVKQTKDGLEIKMRDQDGALDRVARHLGMYVDRHEHTGKDGGAIQQESTHRIPPDLHALLLELTGRAPA